MHRPMLVYRQPNLLCIDGIPVSPEERAKAELYFMEQAVNSFPFLRLFSLLLLFSFSHTTDKLDIPFLPKEPTLLYVLSKLLSFYFPFVHFDITIDSLLIVFPCQQQELNIP